MGARPFVAVTGGAGRIGRALRTLLADARFLTGRELEVTDRAEARAQIRGVDVVIHLAAMTEVDACEAAPAAAFAVNSQGTRNVVDAAQETGARVVYLSTDYVFDGCKQGAYSEDDSPAPINVYGRSKLEGERYVAHVPGNLIVRTSWVYGEGDNFIRFIIGAARAGTPLRIVDDQRGRPTWTRDLAGALVRLLDLQASGIFHVAGRGPSCTRAELAERTLRASGLSAGLERISSAQYARDAPSVVAARPSNSVLSLAKARASGIELPDWRSSVDAYLAALRA